jgi:hypothetical protein
MTEMELSLSIGCFERERWSWPVQRDQRFVIVVSPTGYRGQADCEPTRWTVWICHFHTLLCYLASTTIAILVRVVVARFVCGCKPIFPQGVALRQEACDKMTCSWLIIVVFCVKSLRSAGKLMPCITMVWKATFEDAEPAGFNYRICVIECVRVHRKNLRNQFRIPFELMQRRSAAVDVSSRCFRS